MLARIGLAAIVFVVGLVAGLRLEGNRRDAQQLEAERAAQDTYRKTVAGWSAAVQSVTQAREAERQQAAADRRDWKRRLDDATRRDDAPLVACGGGLGMDRGAGDLAGAGEPWLTGAFVGVWNGALGIGLPAALGPWGAHGPGAAPDPAATVSPEAALENLADNGELCNDLRGRLLAWQAWARSIGAAP